MNRNKTILSFVKNSSDYPVKLERAIIALQKSQSVVSSLHSVYLELQKKRTTKKGLTEKESDILRAMLVFSASGLDSIVKQLIRDTLLEATKKNEDVQKQLEKYVEKKLRTKDEEGLNIFDTKNLATILSTPSPFERIIKLQEKDLTDGSLQSKDELLKIASTFAVKPEEIISNLMNLKEAFDIRNQIIHEMDINFDRSTNRRRSRNSQQMCFYSNLLLEVGSNFIEAIKLKLIN